VATALQPADCVQLEHVVSHCPRQALSVRVQFDRQDALEHMVRHSCSCCAQAVLHVRAEARQLDDGTHGPSGVPSRVVFASSPPSLFPAPLPEVPHAAAIIPSGTRVVNKRNVLKRMKLRLRWKSGFWQARIRVNGRRLSVAKLDRWSAAIRVRMLLRQYLVPQRRLIWSAPCARFVASSEQSAPRRKSDGPRKQNAF